MKIRYKLAAGFTIPILLMAALGIVSLWQLYKVAHPLRKDIPEAVAAAVRLQHLNSLSQLIRYYDEVLTQSARNFAFTRNPHWQQRYGDVEPKLDAAIKEVLRDGDQRDRELFTSIDQANLSLVEMEHRSMQLVQTGRAAEAVALLDSQGYWDQKAIYQMGLTDYAQRSAHESGDALDVSAERIRSAHHLAEQVLRVSILWILSAVITGVLLSIGTGVVIFRAISQPLERLKTAAAALGQGDLRVDIGIHSRDEMGQSATSFTEMAANLRDTTASMDSLHREIAERQRAAAALQESEA